MKKQFLLQTALWIAAFCLPTTLAAISPDTLSLKLDGLKDEWILDSIADAEGNLYVAGATESPDVFATLYRDDTNSGTVANVEQNNLRQVSSTHQGGTDLFVAKFDHNGEFLWAKLAGGSGEDAATGLQIDLNGNLFVFGYIEGETYFDATQVNANAGTTGLGDTTRNLFVARIDSQNWEDIAVMPLQAVVRHNGTVVGGQTVEDLQLVTGPLRNTRQGTMPGQSLVLAPATQALTTNGQATFYFKGETVDSQLSGVSPSAGQTWTTTIGLPGDTAVPVCNFGAGGASTNQEGSWAFVGKLIYRANPQAILNETTWEWDWMRPIATSRGSAHRSTITSLLPPSSVGGDLAFGAVWEGRFGVGTDIRTGSSNIPNGVIGAFSTNGTARSIAHSGVNTSIKGIASDGSNGFVAIGEFFGHTATLDPAQNGNNPVINRTTNLTEPTAFIASLTTNRSWKSVDFVNGPSGFFINGFFRALDGSYYLGGSVLGDLPAGQIGVTASPGPSSAWTAFAANVIPRNGEFDVNWFQKAPATGPSHTSLLYKSPLQALYWNIATGVRPSFEEASGDGLNAQYWNDGPAVVTGNFNGSVTLDIELDTWYTYDTQGYQASFDYPGNLPAYGTLQLPVVKLVQPNGTEHNVNMISQSVNFDLFSKGQITLTGLSLTAAQGTWKVKVTSLNNWEGPSFEETIYFFKTQKMNLTFGTTTKSGPIGTSIGAYGSATSAFDIPFVPVGTTPTLPNAFSGITVENAPTPLPNINYSLLPVPIVQGNYIAARLTGYLYAPETGNYALNIASGGGHRLTIGSQVVSDTLTGTPRGGASGAASVSLAGGRLHAFRLDFAEKTSRALSLTWRKPSDTAHTVIAQKYFFTTLVDEKDILVDDFKLLSRLPNNTDLVTKRGNLLVVTDPKDGLFQDEFQYWLDYIVGQRMTRPSGTVYNANVPTQCFGLPIGPAGSELFNSLVFGDEAIYLAGPGRARLTYPTNASQSETLQPMEGHAVRARWPETAAEGLIECIWGADEFGNRVPNVELKLGNNAINFGQLQFTTSPAHVTVEGVGSLKINADAYSTLHFTTAGTELNQSTPILRVVKSTNLRTNMLASEAIIGSTITPPIDSLTAPPAANSPPRTGHVMRPNARVAGNVGDSLVIYNRDMRTGQIIPVNRETEGSDGLIVAWYQHNSDEGNDTDLIEWPYAAIQYAPRWPTTADATKLGRITIASELGTEGRFDGANQPLFTFATQSGFGIYHQANKSALGYNPNEEHALLETDQSTGDVAAYALRNDLNNNPGSNINNVDPADYYTSDAHVLVHYFEANQWKFGVYEVVVEDHAEGYHFTDRSGVAGTTVFPIYPLWKSSLTSAATEGEGQPFFLDRNQQIWAKAAGALTIYPHYELNPALNFWFDADGDGEQDQDTTDVPWLASQQFTGQPTGLNYTITWPANIPTIRIGDTLTVAKNGLPGIFNWARADVIFDSNDPSTLDANNPSGASANKATEASVRIYDMMSPRVAPLPANVTAEGIGTQIELKIYANDDRIGIPTTVTVPAQQVFGQVGVYEFPQLPADLRQRFIFKATSGFLFQGMQPDANVLGEVVLLPNILTEREAGILKLIGDKPDVKPLWDQMITELYHLTRNPQQIDTDSSGAPDQELLVGLNESEDDPTKLVHAPAKGGVALSTAFAPGSGYVTLVENNDLSPEFDGTPIDLKIIRIVDQPYVGQLISFENQNRLDERFVMRHRGDFGGRCDELFFEWYWTPAGSPTDGQSYPAISDSSAGPGAGWSLIASGNGLNSYTIEGGVEVLSDGYVLVRYRGLDTTAIDPIDWHGYAGDSSGGSDNPVPMLTEGWVKRSLNGINAFEVRHKDFDSREADSYVTMVRSAGTPYAGDVALNGDDTEYISSVGLIELYQTILNRAKRLSLDATWSLDEYSTTAAAVNDQLLFASTRIADLYTMLGNEAYADALDPTIAYTTSSSQGYLAPALHAFIGLAEVPDLLDEELIMLRGRQIQNNPVFPIYNRLPGNFSTDGEPIYATTYGSTDQDGDGDIDEYDALIQFPHGHGDALGHYLSAIKSYYALLRHPKYRWLPRTEATSIGGSSIAVDYLSESKFAQAAVSLARAGLATAELEYRKRYTGDPAGQWQGYKDANTARAWGVDEWARRTGQGAYINWVVGNAMLPEEDTEDTSLLSKIDRNTVAELNALTSVSTELESKISRYDSGLNPLGLNPSIISFDIDPSMINAGVDSRTPFEQTYDKALDATKSALSLFDYANEQAQLIRNGEQTAADFNLQLEQQELDFKSRLIEIFGYPYDGDIGVNGTYPTGYNGPDLFHYMYLDAATLNVDPPSINGGPTEVVLEQIEPFNAGPSNDENQEDKGFINSFLFASDFIYNKYDPNPLHSEAINNTDVVGYEVLDVDPNATLAVKFPFVSTADYSAVAAKEWGNRPAPGRLQLALMEAVRLQVQVLQSQADYQALVQKVVDETEFLEVLYNVKATQISLIDDNINQLSNLGNNVAQLQTGANTLLRFGESVYRASKTLAEFIPKNTILGFSFGGDVASGVRGALSSSGFWAQMALYNVGGALETRALTQTAQREFVNFTSRLRVEKQGYPTEVQQQLTKIETMLRDELTLRYQITKDIKALESALAQYQSTLGEGQRILQERALLRRQAAGTTQQARYQDMTFRIFRNESLQKYRAAFDLASAYTYLAARAFDYETTLLSDSSNAGWKFYDSIIRHRSLGKFTAEKEPLASAGGLSDSLNDLKGVHESVVGAYGFNTPLQETTYFSLRREAFRIKDNADGDAAWRNLLNTSTVRNVWDVPEFRQFCIPSRPESAGPLPAIILDFETVINSGENFFAHPAVGGDSVYDTSRYATRIASAGIWLENYNGKGLIATPRAYLVPVGTDVMRSPLANRFDTREFTVLDQSIPVPRLLGNDYITDPNWSPLNDMAGGQLGQLRRSSMIPANHDGGFNESQLTTDTRLISRSVWNTKWMFIITGDTLLNPPQNGIQRFIFGDPNLANDNGVTDIRIFFETYSHSGQ